MNFETFYRGRRGYDPKMTGIKVFFHFPKNSFEENFFQSGSA
jgi:hypothetical protein